MYCTGEDDSVRAEQTEQQAEEACGPGAPTQGGEGEGGEQNSIGKNRETAGGSKNLGDERAASCRRATESA